MSLLEQMFSNLPGPLQQAACHLEGWRIHSQRYGGHFGRYLARAEARGRASSEELRRYRDERLAAFWRHAVETTPYYQRFRGIEITGLESLAQLPVLTKADLQGSLRPFCSTAVSERQWQWAHTSGTTGAGLRFPVTREAHQEQWAVWWRYRRAHGLDLDTWCGYFGGRMIVPLGQTGPPFWRLNGPGRQILFSGAHLREDRLPSYLAELRRRRPPWLHGYPSLLALLAEYLISHGEEPGFTVRTITTGAENLAPHQARQIERAFGVRPRQHYGMTEGVANISECEHGNLHVDEDYAAVEFLPAGSPGLYRVVGTNFTNPAMPLFRYEVGDHVRLAEGACPCGRGGRRIAQIDGRAEDYLELADGTRLGRLDHIFKDAVRIREAQIVQAEAGEMTVRVVRGPGYGPADEEGLAREIRFRVGTAMKTRIEYVEALERTGTGKLRLVINQRAGRRGSGFAGSEQNT